ncbi:hypothetical protein HDV63DRAFT_372502 [Trichoderma sp. SZMC 28014]
MTGATTSDSAPRATTGTGATTGAAASSATGSASGGGAPSGVAPSEAADDIEFAVFYGNNPAAAHLLEVIHLTSSPPGLKNEGGRIGYHLSVPASYSGGLEHLKWRIGAGTSRRMMEKELPSVEPEILLSPPLQSPSASLARQYIKDFHASIYFHPQSGALIFETRSSDPVLYDMGVGGKCLDLTRSHASDPERLCALWQKNNLFLFGRYWFELEICLKDEDMSRFRDFQDRNLKRHYCGLPPSKLLDFIPGTNPVIRKSGEIWLQQRIPNTKLRASVHTFSGQPLVVEKFENNHSTREYINSRFQFARQRTDKDDDNSRVMLTNLWCENDACGSRHLEELLEVCDCPSIYYAMPLTANNFRDASWDQISVQDRLRYFYQTLQGLAELHQQHSTHGCILPDSLVFRERELPSSKDHGGLLREAGISLSLQLNKFHGSACAAPEIWDNQKDLDQTKVDIWALAASWLLTYMDPIDDIRVTEPGFGIRESLDDLLNEGMITESLFHLMGKMLSWKPEGRPSAKEVLANKAWEPIWEQERAENANKKRGRMQEMQQHHSEVGEPKKVKVVSPNNDY